MWTALPGCRANGHASLIRRPSLLGVASRKVLEYGACVFAAPESETVAGCVDAVQSQNEQSNLEWWRTKPGSHELLIAWWRCDSVRPIASTKFACAKKSAMASVF